MKETYFFPNTPVAVQNTLEQARYSGARLKLYFGNQETGKDEMREWQVEGCISRSRGKVQVPILLSNKRSMFGGQISSDKIVRIKQNGVDIYRHPRYHQPSVELRESSFMAGYVAEIWIDGSVYSRHETLRGAKLLLAKLK